MYGSFTDRFIPDIHMINFNILVSSRVFIASDNKYLTIYVILFLSDVNY